MVGMTFQRVLVPVDDSPHVLELAQQATEFARETGVTLTFLHVVNTPKITSAKDIEQQKREYRWISDECREKAAAQGVSASSRVEVGSPVETIVSIAEHEKFDLIIMGSKGQSHLRTLLVGSVADQVMEHASCPVLLLK